MLDKANNVCYGNTTKLDTPSNKVWITEAMNIEETKTRLWHIWRLMVGRCHNEAWNNYFTKTYYRDKGISVCDEWRYDYGKFKRWSEANGYNEGMSIDRINPDGNYEPSNCRWIPLNENRTRHRRYRTVPMTDSEAAFKKERVRKRLEKLRAKNQAQRATKI